jgi:uncharacterized protein
MFEMILILLGIGLVAGSLGSVFGLGGGILITPSLAILGFGPSQIASTSLIAVNFTSASSTIAYSRRNQIDYKTATSMAIFSIPGALLGALMSDILNLDYFRVLFAIILGASAIYIAFKSYFLKTNPANQKKWAKRDGLLFYAGSLAAGMVSSIFGIGGGIIFVPLMVIVLRMPLSSAAPTSQLTLLISSLTGTAGHIFLGHPEYLYALILGTGSFIGAQVGAILFQLAREDVLRKLYALLLLAIAAKLVLDYLYSVIK